MTSHSLTIPAYLTGRLDTPQESATSLAFDLTRTCLQYDDVALELLVEQPQRGGCAAVEIRDGAGRCYGRTQVQPSAGPIRVFLNTAAAEDVRRASGGFFALDAVLVDADGVHQSYALGAGHVALLTVTRQQPVSAHVLPGAA